MRYRHGIRSKVVQNINNVRPPIKKAQRAGANTAATKQKEGCAVLIAFLCQQTGQMSIICARIVGFSHFGDIDNRKVRASMAGQCDTA